MPVPQILEEECAMALAELELFREVVVLFFEIAQSDRERIQNAGILIGWRRHSASLIETAQ
jgi:hypothetical protein